MNVLIELYLLSRLFEERKRRKETGKPKAPRRTGLGRDGALLVLLQMVNNSLY